MSFWRSEDEERQWQRGAKERSRVRWEVPLFPVHQQPTGMLPPVRSAHALFYYYLQARLQYEKYEEPDATIIVQAGDEWKSAPVVNYRAMLLSIAAVYGVTPDEMVKHWPSVDAECLRVGLPLLPVEDKYRMDAPMFVDSEGKAMAGPSKKAH